MSFNHQIDAMKNDIIKTTQELIRFKSVEGQPEPGAPFGKPMRECLDRALELCEEMGFRTKNINGYAGHAEYGEGDEIIGILVHLDVVPEGTGWSVEPYSGEVVDGKLFGRGSIDDKGPAVAAMYALKTVKEAGIQFNKRVRIIFGCDEETGRWDCMRNYFKSEEMPSCGFSPDADFPIINSEKGITIFDLFKSFTTENSRTAEGIQINYIKGGNRPNMVPEYCECELLLSKDFESSVKKAVEAMQDREGAKFELTFAGEKCLVKSYGVSAHGSTPEKGINAISQMMVFLNSLPLAPGPKAEFIQFMANKIGMETDGTSFGLFMEDEVSGKLVFNLGVFELNDTLATCSVNLRYPVTKTRDEVYAIIEETAARSVVEYREVTGKGPLYVPADNFLVQKLKEVYERITGEQATLISIGGGTYSRAIQNAVAFGPLFPGREELAHQKDEYIAVDDLLQCTKLYAEAISELIK